MPADRPRRRWSRLDRVNESLREVVAEELERIGDDRLGLVTITGVRVDPDLRRALVWFSALTKPVTAEGTDDPADVLAEHRVRLQAAIARQVRLKRTPGLVFQPDPAIAVGTRVDDILRGLPQSPTGTEEASPGDDSGPGGRDDE